MKPESQQKWLADIDLQIARRQKTIEETTEARNSADSPMTSRYDTQRDIFNDDLNINLDGLEADKRFRDELVEAGECEKVQSGAVVILDFGDGEEPEKILFMKNYGSLPDVQVVSQNSPIGSVIVGLKTGDKTVYNVKDTLIPVQIKAVE